MDTPWREDLIDQISYTGFLENLFVSRPSQLNFLTCHPNIIVNAVGKNLEVGVGSAKSVSGKNKPELLQRGQSRVLF